MALLGNLGPLQMADCIGLDVCYLNMLSMLEATNDPKYTPPRTLAQFVQEGQLGVKSKLGFYDYTSMDIDVHNGFTTQQIVDNLMLAYDGAVPQTDMGPGSPAIVYFSDSPDQQQQQQQQQQQDQPQGIRSTLNSRNSHGSRLPSRVNLSDGCQRHQ
ncbi:hypothetical protein BC831DRAFT_275507 [Entophlyctis helioformis]|nr:hypothetical protein BC831DRAFT_275507 [Entophlyctis helioformis]